MKTRRILIAVILAILTSVVSVLAEEAKIDIPAPTMSTTAGSEPVESSSTMQKNNHAADEKEHKHDEEMHGMMMGHSRGWMIVMGAVMVVMMVAHVAVLF